MGSNIKDKSKKLLEIIQISHLLYPQTPLKASEE
jgi:hypothetical protein